MARIVIEAEYPYPRALVWDALTDPAALQQWLMDNDFKAEVGHRFRLRAKPSRHWRGIVDGEVLVVEKPARLVYTWIGDEGGPATTVTWTLDERDGRTRVRLEHAGFRGLGGLLLSKLILGPGWRKLVRRLLPIVLEHVAQHGLAFPAGRWLIPEKACHSLDGPPSGTGATTSA